MDIDKKTLAHLSGAEKKALLAKLLKEKRASQPQTFPLSFSQERLWFLDRLAPGNPAFNIHQALPIAYAINVEALGKSLDAIVARHESLRTVFVEENGAARQRVLPPEHLELEVDDLTQAPFTNIEAEALRRATEEATAPFDLAKGPLIRARLLKRGPADFVFLLTLHHIVGDGWSMGIFFRELTEFYTSFAAGRVPDLLDLPIQYGDYAAWQRTSLQGEKLSAQLDYWMKALDGVEELGLPTDRPRPAAQSANGASWILRLPADLTRKLKALSEQHNVTLFMTLLTAFKALLARYTRQEDIVVGTYVANRTRAEVEPLIGFFVNTLAIRSRVSDDATFLEVLSRVKEATLGAQAHQELPFPRLVAELRPGRDMSRNPIFQVVFQLFNAPGTGGESSSQDDQSLLAVETGSSIFDLSVNMWQSPEGLCAQFEYSTDLFDESTIRRLGGHYRNVLEHVSRRPDVTLSEIELLSHAERREIVEVWNATAKSYPQDRGIPELFDERCESSPDSVAFLCEGEAMTYRELRCRVDTLAAGMCAAGVGAATVVGVHMERSLDLPATMLAILKLGAVYLPLDPSYPTNRLEYMLQDSEARYLVTNRHLAATLNSYRGVVICADALDCEKAAATLDAVPLDLDKAATLFYTSGSTGQPKGVLSPHRQLLNRLHWMWREYPFEKGEVGCQKTALSFVDSLWELLGGLLQGFPAVIAPGATVRDTAAFVHLLETHRVTRLWLVPSLLKHLLDSFPNLGERLPALKFWVSSGEPLPVKLWNQFRIALPEARLFNLYGTSEVWDVTWHDPASDDLSAHTHVPIGKPIDNIRAYVLDHRLAPVPPGVRGELYVAGDALSHGYLRQPDLNAERFPMIEGLNGAPVHAYRTGDFARYQPDGALLLDGRADGQVKVRGFRVEVGEIEAVLLKNPSVRNVAVISDADASMGNARLVAFVEGASEEGFDVERLRGSLLAELPDHMVPAAFIVVDEFPMTPSGKTDRRVLRARLQEGVTFEQKYVEPRDEAESRLARIWEKILNVERVGVETNFFHIGGHSLLATQVVSRINEAFSLDFPLRRFFEKPTVALLAEELKAMSRDGEAPQVQPVLRKLSRERFKVRRNKERGGRG